MNRKLLNAIIYPPLLVGVTVGLLWGGSWLFDNHPALLATIVVIIVWGGWSIIIYEESCRNGGS